MADSTFLGFQILGASNMVRFCSTILGSRPRKDAKINNGRATVDMCVSGKRIRNLQDKLQKTDLNKLANNIIICIGTNDVIRMKKVHDFKVGVYTIVKKLRGKKVVWLTVAPMPKYANSEPHCRRIRQFNDTILKCAKQSNTRVLNLHGFCHKENGEIREELFTKFYRRPKWQQNVPPREDGIHFNCSGLRKMAMWLKREL